MDTEADNISMGSNGSTKPRFKKRSKMNQQEKKEDNAQKWVKEKAREDPAYEPKPKKPKVNHKYAYEFRFPKRWGDKITLTDYHTLMGEFGARSIRAAMSIIEGEGTLAKEETSLGSGMWIEYGDQFKDFSQLDPKDRFGHVFFLFPRWGQDLQGAAPPNLQRGRRGPQNFPCYNGGQGPQGQVDNEHQCSPLAGDCTDWSLAGGKGCKFPHHSGESQRPQIPTGGHIHGGGLPQPT